MTLDSIIAEIDAEIERLTQAKKLLASAGTSSSKPARQTRATKSSSSRTRGKRVLSAEARKRIADAQRRRWAAQKGKSKKDA